MGVALFFSALGVVGLLRFPDVYTRLHAATKCTTFGSLFLGMAIIGYGLVKWYNSAFADPYGLTFAVHTFIALVALLLTNPTGAHAIARAAHKSGVKPTGAVVDRLEEVRR
ncbi:MAG: monovalent cation/H(+) antiporter subunit G [Candidatus Thermoplasmatota archaeon]|nr:monovalent cation/H(+) antiporter subunit G [Candidatus Thermoplasmatota archaeon]